MHKIMHLKNLINILNILCVLVSHTKSVSNSLLPHGLWPNRLFHPRGFPGIAWRAFPFSSPGVFLTQGSNLGLPHCKQILYHLSHQGSSSNKF